MIKVSVMAMEKVCCELVYHFKGELFIACGLSSDISCRKFFKDICNDTKA